MDDAKPAPAGGQPWARALVKAGDKHCLANQKLRLQTQDALELQRQNPFRTPSLFDQRAPGAWVKSDRRADVPGRPVPGRADRRPLRREPQAPDGKPERGISIQNGVHADSLGPSTITRWAEFLELYVAGEVPHPAVGIALSGALYQLPRRRRRGAGRQSRFAGITDVAAAGDLRARPARARADGQRRRPAGPGLDRRHLGARLRRLAAARGAATATSSARAGRSASKPATAAAALHRRPARPAAPDAARRRRGGRLEGAAAVRLGAARRRQGRGLRHRAARPGHRHRRPVQPRPLPQSSSARHRPAGHAQRGPPRRQRDLRPERLAARLAPQARRAPVDRPRPRSRPT